MDILFYHSYVYAECQLMTIFSIKHDATVTLKLALRFSGFFLLLFLHLFLVMSSQGTLSWVFSLYIGRIM